MGWRGAWTGWRLAVAAVAVTALVVCAGGVGRSAPSGASASRPSDALSVNLTYADMGGSWNCGQGHETFEFFSNAQGGLQPYSYLWTFGDGSPSSTDPTPVHAFDRFGEFVVNVSVRDDAGRYLNASVSPIWAIPLFCSTSGGLGPVGVLGIAVYVALFAAILLGSLLVLRVRRRRAPLPPGPETL